MSVLRNQAFFPRSWARLETARGELLFAEQDPFAEGFGRLVMGAEEKVIVVGGHRRYCLCPLSFGSGFCGDGYR